MKKNGFKDGSGRVDVDKWANFVNHSYNSRLATKNRNKRSKAMRKQSPIDRCGQVLVADTPKYRIWGFNAQEKARDAIIKNLDGDNCTKDNFTEEPKGIGEAQCKADNTDSVIYVNKLAKSPNLMIPSWCIAGSQNGQKHWHAYGLNKKTSTQVYLVVSKEHANWRFMAVYGIYQDKYDENEG